VGWTGRAARPGHVNGRDVGEVEGDRRRVTLRFEHALLLEAVRV
jgi:alpha-galactosidase